MRVDQETTEPLSSDEERLVWDKIEAVLDEVGIIIISDYNKGLLSKNLVLRLIREGNERSKHVVVDPKGRDYSKYEGATIITPNKFEVAEVTGRDLGEEASLVAAGQNLLAELNLKALLVTRGEDGMSLFEKGQPAAVRLEARARHVYDVTGAGDTVIATLATAVGAGESFLNAARIANAAAGLVARELGPTAVKLEDLKKVCDGSVD